MTFNQGVEGSIPSAPTKFFRGLWAVLRHNTDQENSSVKIWSRIRADLYVQMAEASSLGTHGWTDDADPSGADGRAGSERHLRRTLVDVIEKDQDVRALAPEAIQRDLIAGAIAGTRL